MWTFLLSFFSGGFGALASGINTIITSIWGSKLQRDTASAALAAQTETAMSAEQQAVQASYAAEMAAPEKKEWFNIFVDGMNRLVRPIFTYGTIALFVYCVADPVKFSADMAALALMPSNMWYILLAIVGFWFGSRMLLDAKPGVGNAVSSDLLAQVQNTIQTINTQRTYDQAMADTKKPLTNSMIIRWNQLNNPGFTNPSATN